MNVYYGGSFGPWQHDYEIELDRQELIRLCDISERAEMEMSEQAEIEYYEKAESEYYARIELKRRLHRILDVGIVVACIIVLGIILKVVAE